MLYSDISELQTLLEIDPRNQAETRKLLIMLEHASGIIEDVLGRRGISFRQRTGEFYNGTGTQKLLLKSHPVFTVPTSTFPNITTPVVYLDEGAWFGSVTGSFDPVNSLLKYGQDYCLQLDWDSDGDGVDDASRAGVLVRINDLWPRPSVRYRGMLSPSVGTGFGTLKVNYWAGHTVDTLPAAFRQACDLLVARLRMIWPLGVELSSESYEERSIAVVVSERLKLLALVSPLLYPYRNWKF